MRMYYPHWMSFTSLSSRSALEPCAHYFYAVKAQRVTLGCCSCEFAHFETVYFLLLGSSVTWAAVDLFALLFWVVFPYSLDQAIIPYVTLKVSDSPPAISKAKQWTHTYTRLCLRVHCLAFTCHVCAVFRFFHCTGKDFLAWSGLASPNGSYRTTCSGQELSDGFTCQESPLIGSFFLLLLQFAPFFKC